MPATLEVPPNDALESVLFDRHPTATLVTDLDHRIIRWNQSAQSFLAPTSAALGDTLHITVVGDTDRGTLREDGNPQRLLVGAAQDLEVSARVVRTTTETRLLTLEPCAPGTQASLGFLKHVIEQTPECVKVVHADGRLLQMNSAGLGMIEASNFEQVTGAMVLDLVAPEDREEWVENHRRVCEGERLSWEFGLVGLEGAQRRMETHAGPVVLPSGETAHVAVTRDITARWEAERRRKLLTGELNHRVKNSLATVSAMAMFTFREASQQDALSRFEKRILALSSAHNLLNEVAWGEADLRNIVANASLTPDSSRVQWSGPSVPVNSQSAIAIAMYLHELWTNAIRHGALSNSEGNVAISWRTSTSPEDQTDRLELSWVESGGPPCKEVVSEGFGNSLITQGVPRQLGGTVDRNPAPAGLQCVLTVPLSSLQPQAPA